MVDKLADSASLLNDLTKGLANVGETEAGNKSGNFGAELDKETLGVGAGDLDDVLDLGTGVTGDVVLLALEVLADGAEDRADGGADTGEAKAGDETSNGGRELDEEVFTTFTDSSQETLNIRAKAGDKVAEGAGAGDDGANGASEARETEGGEEAGNVGAELDQEALGVRAGDLEDLVDLRAEVFEELAGSTGGTGGTGGLGGRGSGGSS